MISISLLVFVVLFLKQILPLLELMFLAAERAVSHEYHLSSQLHQNRLLSIKTRQMYQLIISYRPPYSIVRPCQLRYHSVINWKSPVVNTAQNIFLVLAPLIYGTREHCSTPDYVTIQPVSLIYYIPFPNIVTTYYYKSSLSGGLITLYDRRSCTSPAVFPVG